MKVNLSDGEWKLMQALWQAPPRTITELTADLRAETGWSKNTVITMLSRLEAKGAVRHEEGGRARQYFPVLNQADARRQETRQFLSRVYGGSLGSLVNAMVSTQALTQEEIAELSDILDRAKKEEQP